MRKVSPKQLILSTAMLKAIVYGSIAYSLLKAAPTLAFIPGATDISFDPGMHPPYSGSAHRVIQTPENKLIVCGDFTVWINGRVQYAIMRLNTNGTVDPEFTPQFEHPTWYPIIKAALQLPNGKILVGGTFQSVNGTPATNLVCLSPNGAVDTSFVANVDMAYPQSDVSVDVLALQPDGKILVGGQFEFINGVPRTNIARLNPDGSVDHTFNPTHGYPNGKVTALAIRPDGRIMIGGQFTEIGPHPRNGIAALLPNGNLDTSFGEGLELCEGPSMCVYDIAPLPDSRILIVGRFDTVNSQPKQNIARLNPDGTVDETFNCRVETPFGEWPYATVYTCTLLPNSNILLGGDFYTVNGSPRTNVAIVSPTGVLDQNFDARISYGYVYDALPLSASNFIIAGAFHALDKYVRPMLALIASSGQVDLNFKFGRPGLSTPDGVATVKTILPLHENHILVGGDFTSVQDQPVPSIARLDGWGNLDTNFSPPILLGMAPAASPVVNSLALSTNGKILIGGEFILPRPGTANLSCIAQLTYEGMIDTNFAAGDTGASGENPSIQNITIQKDGHILVAGKFTSFHNANRRNLARLTPTGALDHSFTPIVGEIWESVKGTAIQSDNKIIVYGPFTIVNDQSRAKIARLLPDGTLDTSFTVSFTPNWAELHKVVVLPNDKILIGGSFTKVNGVSRSGIAWLNPDGTLDTTFAPQGVSTIWGSGSVFAIEPQPDGRILIGGVFSQVNGHPRNCIARLLPDGALDQEFGDTLSGFAHYFYSGGARVFEIKWLESENSLLVGGTFDLANDVPRSSLAKLYGSTPAGAQPRLSIELTTTNSVLIKWPTNAGAWVLVQTHDLLITTNWPLVPHPPRIEGTNWVVTAPIQSNRFFRLIRP